MLARLRRHRHPATWLTLVILVLATLAPGVSRALAYGRGDVAALGMHCLMAATPAADGTTEPAHSGPLDHCPLCQLRGDNLAPPPPPLAVPGDQNLRHEAPRAHAAAPQAASIWRDAQPRGPPALT